MVLILFGNKKFLKKEKEKKRVKNLTEMVINKKGAICTSLIQLLSVQQPK